MTTRIREYRKLRGMTLHYLAQKVGTTAQTIQRLETGTMTVSLDWLHRIAEVLGMPAAALLVTDTTASVPILGCLDAHGEVLTTHVEIQPKTLSMVVAIPDPVAARVSEAIASFAPDTVLIGNKIEFDPELLLETRMSLVGFRSGRIVFRRVTCNGHSIVLEAVQGTADDIPAVDIEWVAPIMMAVQYF